MPRRDPAKERYWRLLLQWRDGGAFRACKEQGISVPNFYIWRREIERDREASTWRRAPSSSDASPAFIKLTVDDGGIMPPPIEVVVSERRRLLVRPGFDADLLRQLVRLLAKRLLVSAGWPSLP